MSNNTTGTPFGATFVTTKAGLTGISGGATTFSTGSAAISFCVRGKAGTKTQVSGGATPTTDILTGAAFPVLAKNFGSVFVFAFDGSGNVKVAQGTVEALDASGTFIYDPEFPLLGESYAAFAYVIAKNGSTGSNFTFGSTNWNSTGMSYAVVDVMVLPDRRQHS